MSLISNPHHTLKAGDESFSSNRSSIPFSILDFWKWAYSDILNNTTRGLLAEFIVSQALGCDNSRPRTEWADYDLISPEGIKIEVKSSAYLQSWIQHSHSKVSFSVRKSRKWDWVKDKRSELATREADIYIFCLLAHLDKETIDPLNLDHWEFYVLNTHHLGKDQANISLNALKRKTQAVGFNELKSKVISSL